MDTLSYRERCTKLGLEPLLLRRYYHDISLYHKILHQKVSMLPSEYFFMLHNARTRGRSLQIFKQHAGGAIRLNSFENRSVNG